MTIVYDDDHDPNDHWMIKARRPFTYFYAVVIDGTDNTNYLFSMYFVTRKNDELVVKRTVFLKSLMEKIRVKWNNLCIRFWLAGMLVNSVRQCLCQLAMAMSSHKPEIMKKWMIGAVCSAIPYLSDIFIILECLIIFSYMLNLFTLIQMSFGLIPYCRPCKHGNINMSCLSKSIAPSLLLTALQHWIL